MEKNEIINIEDIPIVLMNFFKSITPNELEYHFRMGNDFEEFRQLEFKQAKTYFMNCTRAQRKEIHSKVLKTDFEEILTYIGTHLPQLFDRIMILHYNRRMPIIQYLQRQFQRFKVMMGELV